MANTLCMIYVDSASVIQYLSSNKLGKMGFVWLCGQEKGSKREEKSSNYSEE